MGLRRWFGKLGLDATRRRGRKWYWVRTKRIGSRDPDPIWHTAVHTEEKLSRYKNRRPARPRGGREEDNSYPIPPSKSKGGKADKTPSYIRGRTKYGQKTQQ